VAASHVYAGLGRRFVAALIDTAILVAVSILLQRAGGRVWRQSDVAIVLLSALAFIGGWGRIGKGYSLGKRAVGIRVVNRDGGVLTLRASALRWLVSIGVVVPLLVLLHGLGGSQPIGMAWAMAITVPTLSIVLVDSLLLLFNRPTHRSLHDLAAGSVVVPRAHSGPVPTTPFWPGHYAWMALCCLIAALISPVAYRFALEIAPRTIELSAAGSRVRAGHRLSRLFVLPGFSTDGADTTRFISVIAGIHATPHDGHEAESLRKALLCALAREAPDEFRGAMVNAIISFDRGSAAVPFVTVYAGNRDLSAAACSKNSAEF
jgi:uncharacterized RDD family membrane protein YckC